MSSDFIDRLVSWPRTASDLQWWSGVEATHRKVFEMWQTEVDSDADLPVACVERWNEPGEAELAHLMVDPAIRCYLRAGYVRLSPEEETEFNARQPRSYTWMRPG